MKKLFAILLSFHLMVAPVVATAQSNTPGTEEKDAYKTTGDGSSGGLAFYVQSLMMTGSGAVGSMFLFCREDMKNGKNVVPTFSHYVFMAGAIVLLMAEIQSAITQKNQQKEQEEELKRQGLLESGPVDGMTKNEKDAQLTLLLEARKNEFNNKEFLAARMNWMNAVRIVYIAAAASAAAEIALYYLTQVLKNSVYPATVAAGNAINYVNWGLTDCGGTDKQKKIVDGIGMAYALSGVIKPLASGDVMGGVMAGVSGVAFLKMLKKFVGMAGGKINTAMKTAPGRLVTFGVFAALAQTVYSGFKTRKEKAEHNIALFDKSIEAWKKAAGVNSEIAELDPGSDAAASDSAAAKAKKAGNIKTLTVNKPKTCMSQDLEVSSAACSGKTFKFSRTQLPSFKTPVLSNAVNSSYDMAEALARDDAAGANIAAGSLNSNAARIQEESDQLIKDANASIVKSGGKAIDFKKEVEAQLASYGGMASSAAQSGGLANASAGKLTVDDAPNTTADVTAPVVKAPVAVAPEGALDLSLGGGSDEVIETPVAAAASAQSLDDFESTEQDISKKPEVSIFKQLSNRYILNYTKMFETKKKAEAVEEPAKN